MGAYTGHEGCEITSKKRKKRLDEERLGGSKESRVRPQVMIILTAGEGANVIKLMEEEDG